MTDWSSKNIVSIISTEVNGITIKNIYKPPVTKWSINVIKVLDNQPTVYIGDFNSRHKKWGYENNDKNDPFLHTKKFLQIHGFEGPKKYFWHITAVLKSIIMFGRTIYACQILNQPKLLADFIATYPVGLMAIIKMYMLFFDKKRVQYFYDTVKNEFWDFQIVDPEVQLQIKKRVFITHISILFHLCAPLLILLFLCVTPIVDMPEGKRPLTCINWTPFDIEPSPRHEIFYVIMIWNYVLSVIVNVVFDVIYLYAYQHLCVQIIVLKELLQNIAKDLMKGNDDCKMFSSEDFQNKVYRRLKICVAHHVKLLKFGKNLEEFCSVVLLPQLVMSYAALAINGFIISVNHSDDLVKAFIITSVSFASFVQLALFAISASDLEDQCLSVMDSIICSDWYLFKYPLKRALIIMLMNSKIPISIRAGGLVKIMNPVLIEILQKAFSTIVLLRALTGVE
ncbi:uncharacterized protein [Diabrotica undecimpunctata]|uniref:uncharacterized protein n=1 Tax=Diabrotica undecimpunctata TaxID=50387 RepID=UPI003B641516